MRLPDPLGHPQCLEQQRLSSSLIAPRQPLVDWLRGISSPLQCYDNNAVREGLMRLWGQLKNQGQHPELTAKIFVVIK